MKSRNRAPAPWISSASAAEDASFSTKTGVFGRVAKNVVRSIASHRLPRSSGKPSSSLQPPEEIGRSDADADDAGIAKPVDQLVEIGERRVAGFEHQIGIRKAVFVRLAGADLAGEVDQHGFQRTPADLDADAVDPLGRKPIERGRRSALAEPFSHLLYESRRLQPVDNVGDRSRRQVCRARQVGLRCLLQTANGIEHEALVVMPNLDGIAAFPSQTGVSLTVVAEPALDRRQL